MKAKLVTEEITRGKMPIGRTSDQGIDSLIKSWEKKGINFGHLFFSGNQVEEKREFFSKYSTYIEKYLNQLNKAGVPWDKMTFWGDHVDIKAYQITKGNWSLFHCLTKEDAELLVSVLKNITTGSQNFYITEEREHINLSDKIHMETDSEHRKWMESFEKRQGETRRTDLDFLENIEETRKKLKSIKLN